MFERDIYTIHSTYREDMHIKGFQFGKGEKSACIVGAARGNEIQQMYICSQLVKTLLYTAVLIATIALTLTLMSVGDRLLLYAVDNFGLPRFWAALWADLRFPVAAVAGYFALFFLYALSQDGRQPWRNIWPGTMAALGAWLLLNWLYASYVQNFADYSLLYGSIGTAIALLIWLYMTAVTLIMGAEVNGTLISLRKDRSGES